MQQLVDDTAHGTRDLVALAVSEVGKPGVEAHEFALDDLRCTLTQCGDGGCHLCEPLRGEVAGEFRGHDRARCLGIVGGGTRGGVALQRFHVEHRHTGKSRHGRFDVTGQSEIADRQRAFTAVRLCESAVGVGEGDDRPHGSGAGDGDIGLRQRGGQVTEIDNLGGDTVSTGRCGEALGTVAGAVREDDLGDTRPGQMRYRETAHRTCADDCGSPSLQAFTAEQRPCLVECNRHDGCTGRVDPGFRVHALADTQCLLGEFVQCTTRSLLSVGGRVGGADLPEDLLLTDHHGIETTGHREQMLCSGLAVAHVGVLVQIREGESGVFRQ